MNKKLLISLVLIIYFSEITGVSYALRPTATVKSAVSILLKPSSAGETPDFNKLIYLLGETRHGEPFETEKAEEAAFIELRDKLDRPMDEYTWNYICDRGYIGLIHSAFERRPALTKKPPGLTATEDDSKKTLRERLNQFYDMIDSLIVVEWEEGIEDNFRRNFRGHLVTFLGSVPRPILGSIPPGEPMLKISIDPSKGTTTVYKIGKKAKLVIGANVLSRYKTGPPLEAYWARDTVPGFYYSPKHHLYNVFSELFAAYILDDYEQVRAAVYVNEHAYLKLALVKTLLDQEQFNVGWLSRFYGGRMTSTSISRGVMCVPLIADGDCDSAVYAYVNRISDLMFINYCNVKDVSKIIAAISTAPIDGRMSIVALRNLFKEFILDGKVRVSKPGGMEEKEVFSRFDDTKSIRDAKEVLLEPNLKVNAFYNAIRFLLYKVPLPEDKIDGIISRLISSSTYEQYIELDLSGKKLRLKEIFTDIFVDDIMGERAFLVMSQLLTGNRPSSLLDVGRVLDGNIDMGSAVRVEPVNDIDSEFREGSRLDYRDWVYGIFGAYPERRYANPGDTHFSRTEQRRILLSAPFKMEGEGDTVWHIFDNILSKEASSRPALRNWPEWELLREHELGKYRLYIDPSPETYDLAVKAAIEILAYSYDCPKTHLRYIAFDSTKKQFTANVEKIVFYADSAEDLVKLYMLFASSPLVDELKPFFVGSGRLEGGLSDTLYLSDLVQVCGGSRTDYCNGDPDVLGRNREIMLKFGEAGIPLKASSAGSALQDADMPRPGPTSINPHIQRQRFNRELNAAA